VMPASLAEKVLPLTVRGAFGDGQRLLISPHEDLRGLPLHALALDGDDLVIDRWPVQYVPTLAMLPLRRQGTRPDGVLAVGCVKDKFGGGMLEDVAEEIDNVQKAWSRARPGHVTNAILPPGGSSLESIGVPFERWREFDVIHLACHGVFPDARPFDAALLLGDKQLGGSDIFTFRLHCSLVALSACSLGRSDSEETATDVVVDEWAGLYLPFFYAGADMLLVSLWKADSRTALLFMSALHRALSEGAPPSIAYTKAVAAVRSRPDSLWANWYLTGIPS
jgi:CHAT domain-containing protein